MDLFFPTVLLGPLLGGLIAAALGKPWWYGALPFVLYFGIWGLVSDWFLRDVPEDRFFHVVLTLLMLALAAAGGVAGRRIRSPRASSDLRARLRPDQPPRP